MKGKLAAFELLVCDICQTVCPWNKFSKPHNEPLFEIQFRTAFYSKKRLGRYRRLRLKKYLKLGCAKN
jgi:epoxyqueuosine reductase QueG